MKNGRTHFSVVGISLMLAIPAFLASACGKVASEKSLTSGVTQSSGAQGEIGLVPSNAGFVPVMSVSQFTPNGKKLQLTFSLQSSILTNTVVSSQQMKKSTSTADAGIDIQFLVDGAPVLVGTKNFITFNQRMQQLSATLQGAINTCQASSTGLIVVTDPTGATASNCTFTSEEIGLLVQTTSANSFSVTTPSLSSGKHTIQIMARVSTSTSTTQASTTGGSAQAWATLDIGSLIANVVQH